jgi:hypothetical protein
MTTELKQAKAQARRLSVAMGKAGRPVALSQAYELLAQSAGHADWNTMAARLATPAGIGWTLGQAVRGRYMDQPITGRIHALARKGAAHVEVELALDQPVDVAASAHFTALRRRVRATLGGDGRSVGRRSDGVPHLVLE